jgi:hypothetical protein
MFLEQFSRESSINVSKEYEETNPINTVDVMPKAEVLNTVLYTIPEYHNGIYVAAVIKNTGDTNIEINNRSCSFDIEDESGNFVYHLDNLKVAPSIVAPDEIAYLVSTKFSDDIDLDSCYKAITNLSYELSGTQVSIFLDIEDTQIGDFSDFYVFPGRVINSLDHEAENIQPFSVLFDDNDNFLGVNINQIAIEKIPANSKIGHDGKSSSPIPLSAFSEHEIGRIESKAVVYIDLEEPEG